jgi:hypothetical protein
VRRGEVGLKFKRKDEMGAKQPVRVKVLGGRAVDEKGQEFDLVVDSGDDLPLVNSRPCGF